MGVNGATHRSLLGLGNGHIALCVNIYKVLDPSVIGIRQNGVRSFLVVEIALGERLLALCSWSAMLRTV